MRLQSPVQAEADVPLTPPIVVSVPPSSKTPYLLGTALVSEVSVPMRSPTITSPRPLAMKIPAPSITPSAWVPPRPPAKPLTTSPLTVTSEPSNWSPLPPWASAPESSTQPPSWVVALIETSAVTAGQGGTGAISGTPSPGMSNVIV
jgi:hypothetical protein